MADTALTEEAATRLGAPRYAGERPAHPGRLLCRSLLAAAGGVLIFLAFPPVDVWPLAPVGAGALVLATCRQRARWGALLGFLGGLGLFVPLLSWVRVIGVDVWIGLAVLQAGYWTLLGAGLALVTRLPGWPAWTAALWVTVEAVRGRFPFGGFSWGRLAFSQGHSAFTPYASVAGAPFVTFLVALTGALATYAVLCLWRGRRGGTVQPAARLALRARHPGLTAAAAATASALAIPAAGYAVPLPTRGEPVTVAAVQGNTPAAGLAAETQTPPLTVLKNHVEATRRLADRVRSGEAPRPDFAVWPETASPINLYVSEYARLLIADAVDDLSAPVLIGAYVSGSEPGALRNVGIAWSPQTGPGDTYAKRHLVPFGEYIPYRDVLTRYFERLEMVGADKVPGEEPGALRIAGTTIADAICFDVAYDGVVRDAVISGGKLLVVQTNNNTYLGTAQPEQQLSIERLRAVEHGRAVVVAAISGISAIISPDGRLVEVAEPFTQQVLVERLPLRSDLTVADRLGPAPLWVLTSLGVLTVALAVAASAREKRRRR